MPGWRSRPHSHRDGKVRDLSGRRRPNRRGRRRPSAPSRLDIAVRRGVVAAGVRLHSELDRRTSEAPAGALTGLREDGHLLVVLDLTGLRTCTAAGPWVLTDAHTSALPRAARAGLAGRA